MSPMSQPRSSVYPALRKSKPKTDPWRADPLAVPVVYVPGDWSPEPKERVGRTAEIEAAVRVP